MNRRHEVELQPVVVADDTEHVGHRIVGPQDGRTERDVNDLLQPVSTVLVPIFFVLMGLKVDLRLFARVDILGYAAALTVAAIVGKQICALGIVERGVNRLAIGLGMIPRGEVGLNHT